MVWNENLQGKAYDIAASSAKQLRVLAGPGTGKSYAMKRRIIRLLEEGEHPSRILVLTFTRVAAASMVAELKNLGVPGCEVINAGTLHSFCLRLLFEAEVLEFLGRTPRALVTFSTNAVLQFEASPLLADVSPDGRRKGTKRIQLFEAAWAKRQSHIPGWPAPEDQTFHQSLISWLTFHQGMLIGEVIPETLRYLNQNALSPVLSHYEHVLVDEYQDLNRAEQAITDLLAAKNALIIGDENQSIYGFRHAHPAGILEYSKTHPETIDMDLAECRRCPTKVVELANHLIMANHAGSTTPKLIPTSGNPEGFVRTVQWESMKEEASGVAKYLQALCSEGFEPKDILVLVPRKLLAKGLRAALKDAGVPHHSFYQEEALDSNAAQLAFCLLTLLAFPGDRVALRYWLGSGSKTWRRAEYGKLRTHCENTGESPGEALERAARGLVTIAGVSTLVARYTELYGRLTAMKDLTTLELVNELTKEGDLETDLLRDLLETAASKYETTAKLVDHVRTAVSQPEPAEDANCVRIMSLQKSKGLTSRAVVLAGCIESFLPKVNTSDTIAEQEESVREQRRLFYVAITRPKERLIISSFRTMPAGESYTTGAKVSGKYGNGYTLPSRFIDELGPTAPKAVAGSKWIFESFG